MCEKVDRRQWFRIYFFKIIFWLILLILTEIGQCGHSQCDQSFQKPEGLRAIVG